MRNLIFHEISILSLKERAAKRVIFDPRLTTIIGSNGTGKSSLMKSLYWCLGAEPSVVHSHWKAADPVCLLSFSFAGKKLRILRYKGVFAIFDYGSKVPRVVFKSVSKGLAPFLASLFDYHLILTDKRDNSIVSPPPFLFLPFYIDQDSGWLTPLKSFGRTEYIKSPLLPTLEYHTGIRPDEYYVLKAEEEKLKQELESLTRELRAMQNAQDRVDKALPFVDFSLVINVYAEEIDRLVLEANRLRAVQETYRIQTSTLKGDLEIAKHELALADSAIRELGADYAYAIELEEDVECPTCGNHYVNSVIERFDLAADADSLSVFRLELLSRMSSLEAKLGEVQTKYLESSRQLEQIETLLDSKRGELSLRQIIQSEGRRAVNTVFKSNIEEQHVSMGTIAEALNTARNRIDEIYDATRKKEIVNHYQTLMGMFLQRLNVSSVNEDQYKRLNSKVKETGSVLPRTTLAYQFALLHTIAEFGSATFSPIVIDSPNQQALDQVNLRKVLDFIYTHQPKASQMVVALEETLGLEIPGKQIILEHKGHLLSRGEHDVLAPEILPMLDSALSYPSEPES